MGPKGKEPSTQSQRFRLFLEQLCAHYASADPHDYGAQKVARDLLGWSELKKQSKISQYLSDTPKWAQSKTIEKALGEFKKNTGISIDYRFWHDPDLVNPHFLDFVVGGPAKALPVPSQSKAPEPVEDRTIFGLAFAEEKKLKPWELSRFLAELRNHKFLVEPTRRELELVYRLSVKRPNARQAEDYVRDATAKRKLAKLRGERVDMKSRPPESPKRKTRNKPKPSSPPEPSNHPEN